MGEGGGGVRALQNLDFRPKFDQRFDRQVFFSDLGIFQTGCNRPQMSRGAGCADSTLVQPIPSDAPLPPSLVPLVSPDPRSISRYRIFDLTSGSCAELRAVALMSGQHPRLGDTSPLADLDESLLRQIRDLSETRSLEVIPQTLNGIRLPCDCAAFLSTERRRRTPIVWVESDSSASSDHCMIRL